MMDIAINENGEFLLDRNDIKVIKRDDLRFQEVMCLVKSVTDDWFSERKYGANLEEYIGYPSDQNTANICISKIISEITTNGIYSPSEIHVEYRKNKNHIHYSIFLRNTEKITAKLLEIELDLVAGVNIRIGDD